MIRAKIWDTTGQERYRALAPMYYRGAHGTFLIYNMTDRWLSELRDKAPEDIVLTLVGNMRENEGMRKVSTEEAVSYAEK